MSTAKVIILVVLFINIAHGFNQRDLFNRDKLSSREVDGAAFTGLFYNLIAIVLVLLKG